MNKNNIQSHQHGISVLSLFDGMSCGMIAMLNAGLYINSYASYEIDEHAIKTSKHNFPNIIQYGNVIEADFSKHRGIDYLIGGSPCTYWSITQTANRETEASGCGWQLFSQYVKALKETAPMFFIYENNKSMSKKIRESIDSEFGFEAICINSALLSAQHRERLYWVGKRNVDGTYSKVNVEQPVDRGILLRDILDGAAPVNTTLDGKSYIIRAQYYKNSTANFATNGGFEASGVAEPVRFDTYSKKGLYAIPVDFDGDIPKRAISLADNKKYDVYAINNGMITIKENQYPINLKEKYCIIRKLTIPECKILQTVPEWYDFSCVNNRQAYKMLGNGWTCDVITHLIQATIRESEDCYGRFKR